jgi:hypothetical protein
MSWILAAAWTVAGAARGGEAPMSRIAVREGRFVEKSSGRVFRPRGVNYIRLRPTWHGTFSPKRYDGARAEAMLADLAAHGLNTVRVFIDHAAGEGVVASRDAKALSPRFLANVVDFLARARRHGIRVVPSLIHLPECKRYRDLIGERSRDIAGVNQMYLHEGHTAAKARYAADFVAAIQAHDPGLLTTVLAYELDNETHLDATAPPFSLASGTLATANGQSYDLASEEALQRMADENVAHWADCCVEAIRAVDPEALVSTNVFTFRAVGRGGPGRLRRDQTKDARFPARPLALAKTRLDYLDIHFYPFDSQTLERDLASIEFPQLRAACTKRGKPLVMGEFGAFKSAYRTLPEAAAAMGRHVRRVLGLGFVGWIYWTYDCDEQDFLWNAKSGDGEILEALGREGVSH